jgi:hypothetical protein
MSAFLNQKLGQKPGSTNTPMSDTRHAILSANPKSTL